jgi:hypothetical protein
MKILIFSVTFIFQIYLCKKTVWPFIISAYMDLTEKRPEDVNFQTKTSWSSDKWTVNKRWSNISQTSILSFDEVLLNSIFSGLPVKTSDTRTFLRRTMLYNEGYCSAKGLSPNHMSSQKRVLWPFPTLKEPREKKLVFNSHKSFPKRRVGGFSCHLWQSLSSEIFVMQQLLPKPFLI